MTRGSPRGQCCGSCWYDPVWAPRILEANVPNFPKCIAMCSTPTKTMKRPTSTSNIFMILANDSHNDHDDLNNHHDHDHDHLYNDHDHDYHDHDHGHNDND